MEQEIVGRIRDTDTMLAVPNGETLFAFALEKEVAPGHWLGSITLDLEQGRLGPLEVEFATVGRTQAPVAGEIEPRVYVLWSQPKDLGPRGPKGATVRITDIRPGPETSKMKNFKMQFM